MPWRLRPRAAFLILLSASVLIVATAGVRAPATAPLRPSIDHTLTRDAAGCAVATSIVWHPLSGVDYTGRLRLTMPPQPGGALVLYVGDSLPLDLDATGDAGDVVPMHLERIVTGPGVLVPPDFWLDDGSPEQAPRHIARIQLSARADRTQVVTLSLGRRAPRVLARLVGYGPAVGAPICAAPVGADETYFATGWFGQERDANEGLVRWMRDHGVVMVASRYGSGGRVRVRVSPAAEMSDQEPTVLAVRVNDVWDLAPVTLQDGFHEYEWRVPDPAWVPGTNELLFSVSRTRKSSSRTLGLALASLDVR